MEEVRRLDQSEEEMIYKLSQPVLSNGYDFNFMVNKLRALLL
jgi:hypothetical protein